MALPRLTETDIKSISKDYLSGSITERGKKWRNDERNPVNYPDFSKKLVDTWDEFIRNWVSDENLPLLIRKFGKGFERGTINKHDSGRKLVPVDNSPAQWVFASVCMGNNPPNDVIATLRLDEWGIPVAMVVPSTTLGTNAYRGKLGNTYNTQTYGWYLAHKEPVALGKKILGATIAELKIHFSKLMSPSNMFLVPNDKKILGIPEFSKMSMLAETPGFIEQQ